MNSRYIITYINTHNIYILYVGTIYIHLSMYTDLDMKPTENSCSRVSIHINICSMFYAGTEILEILVLYNVMCVN